MIREAAKMLVIDENKNIQVSQYDTFSIRFRFTNYKLTHADKVVLPSRRLPIPLKWSIRIISTIRAIIL